MATTPYNPNNPFQLPSYNPNAPAAGGVNYQDAFQVLKKEKDPMVGVQISDLFGLFDKIKGGAAGANDEYASNVSANLPQQNQFTSQENAATTDFFNGQIQKRLDSLRELRKAAVTGAANRATSAAGKDLNLLRLGITTGAAPVGNSSYLDKLAMDKQAEIQVGAALDDVNQQSADQKYVWQMQAALRGLRQSALDEAAKRGLLPAQAQAASGANLTALLQALAALQTNNNFYGLGAARGALGA